MSEENVEVVRRAYERVTASLEMSPDLFATDLEWDVTDIGAGVTRGRAVAEEALREYWETFEDFHVEMEEVIHADEKQVVTAVRDGGRIKGTDSEVWNRFFHVLTLGDRKIVRLSVHTDRNRALEAAGLRK